METTKPGVVWTGFLLALFVSLGCSSEGPPATASDTGSDSPVTDSADATATDSGALDAPTDRSAEVSLQDTVATDTTVDATLDGASDALGDSTAEAPPAEVATDAAVEGGPPPDGGMDAPGDRTAPTWPAGSALTVSDVGATAVTLAWTAASDDVGVTSYRVFRDGAVAGTTAGGERMLRVTGLARSTRYAFRVEALDAAGNVSSGGPEAVVTTGTSDSFRPSTNDGTIAANFPRSLEFLYTGRDAPQQDVTVSSLDRRRVAIVRGQVRDRAGMPVEGVEARVADHPEYGRTSTRSDGFFDLVVNGGGPLTVTLRRTGAIPLERTVEVPWGDIALLPEVTVTPPEARSGAVTAGSMEAQAVQGTAVTDPSGERTTTVLFQPGTVATVVLPTGGTAPLATFTARVTELSVGSTGPSALPAELPPRTGYLHVSELGVDEAAAMGATAVRFSPPAAVYVDDFVGAPVGSAVPSGCYDRQSHAWVPAGHGVVVRVLSTAGGRAELDLGAGRAADAAALAAAGITDAERTRLAALFRTGATLLRAPAPTAGACALGFSAARPTDAVTPRGAVPPTLPCPQDDPTPAAGSVIDLENQSLGEALPIAGTSLRLTYRSDRVPEGGANTIELPVSGATVPASLRRILVEVTVAGVRTRSELPPRPDQVFTFHWNGLDAYGRPVQGARRATVRVGYAYPGDYVASRRFGGPPGTPLRTRTATRDEVVDWSVSSGQVGSWDNRPQGLGGWTLDALHAYDPEAGALVLGTGGRASSCGTVPHVLDTVAGDGSRGFAGDGGPALRARFDTARGLAAGPDGSLYVADTNNHRVRRIGPDGTVSTLAGTGTPGGAGDGGPAAAAQLNTPSGVAVGDDGSVFIADTNNHRIRRVAPSGAISTVAGSGTRGFSGDGGAATAGQLDSPRGLAVLPDGTLFIADTGNRRIREVAADGVLRTIAGNGSGVSTLFGVPSPANGALATDAAISDVQALTVGPDGSIYFVDTGIHYVRRVDPAGILRTVGGCCSVLFPGFGGDGMNAVGAQFNFPVGLAVDPDGTLYVADQGNGRVRRISTGGTASTLAGGGMGADALPPTSVALSGPSGVTFGPDGSVFILEQGGNRVRRVRFSSLPRAEAMRDSLVLPSDDRSESFAFDRDGRHTRTVDATTGAVRRTLGYDAAGRLVSLTDAAGNVTRVERDSSGRPTAIIGPYGHRTALALTPEGWLAAITDPTGARTTFTYMGSSGLLATMTDAMGGVHRYRYDALGRLIEDQDPAGGATRLSRATTATGGTTVTRSSASGVTASHRSQRLSDGMLVREVTNPAGLRVTVRFRPDGSSEETLPDGRTLTRSSQPDGRFGMESPVVGSLRRTTPGGRVASFGASNAASLARPGDPLSAMSVSQTFTGPDGQGATLAYDGATRELTERSLSGREVVTHFDTQGRADAIRFRGMAPEGLVYDARGRVTAHSLGTRRVSLAYGAGDRPTMVTDAAGHSVRIEYDMAQRPTRRVLPDGRVVAYSYDPDGRPVSVTPPGRSPHTYTYTPDGLVATYTAPDVGGAAVTRYTYNTDRQLSRATLADGTTVDYGYDRAGRAASVTTSRGANTFAYDPRTGNLATVTAAGGGTLTLRADGEGITGMTWAGPVAGRVEVTLTPMERARTESVNGGPAVTYSYDPDLLVTAVGDLSVTRDPSSGLPTATRAGRVQTTTTYNTYAEATAVRATADGRAVYEADLSREVRGLLTDLTETVGGARAAWRYEYDGSGQLTAAHRDGAVVARYEYDAAGNRTRTTAADGTSVTATYDARDRLQSFGEETFAYTSAGFLRSRTNTRTMASTRYTYDATGALLDVETPTRRVEYVLDGFGRRIGRRVGGALARGYLYRNAQQLAAELDGAGRVVSQFLYTDGRLCPDAMLRGGVTYRILKDHRGSPRVVVNTATGAVEQELEYDPWGRAVRDTNPGFQPFGFAGGLYDADTGLLRFGERDYDPATGRWTAPDPLRFTGGDWNFYRYAFNDPINRFDPTGRSAICEAIVQLISDLIWLFTGKDVPIQIIAGCFAGYLIILAAELAAAVGGWVPGIGYWAGMALVPLYTLVAYWAGLFLEIAIKPWAAVRPWFAVAAALTVAAVLNAISKGPPPP